MNRAVFLDRDGVLIHDVDLLTNWEEVRILEGVPAALAKLKGHGFKLMVVTNQTVVARGMLTEEGVRALNRRIEDALVRQGSPVLDGWYYCPHHPQATLPAYRIDCACRKPRAGLILQGAREQGIDLSASFLVGDRLSDIMAGHSAGCRTILVETGKHTAPPIQGSDPLPVQLKPDHTCLTLLQATDWILHHK